MSEENYLFRKRALNHATELGSLYKWLSIHLRSKWLWVRCCHLNFRYGACFEQGVP